MKQNKLIEQAKEHGIITRYRKRKTGYSVELDLGKKTWKSFIKKDDLEYYMKLEEQDISIIEWEEK